jgi:hypothetical protein
MGTPFHLCSLMLWGGGWVSLAKMFRKAQRNGLLCGLVPHLIPLGWYYYNMQMISSFFKDDVEMSINVKTLFYLYEKMVGLKINFHKSKFY